MPDNDKQTQDEKVECDICMKEIPKSGAQMDETNDYVAHFCGLDCFDKWKHQKENDDQ